MREGFEVANAVAYDHRDTCFSARICRIAALRPASSLIGDCEAMSDYTCCGWKR